MLSISTFACRLLLAALVLHVCLQLACSKCSVDPAGNLRLSDFRVAVGSWNVENMEVTKENLQAFANDLMREDPDMVVITEQESQQKNFDMIGKIVNWNLNHHGVPAAAESDYTQLGFQRYFTATKLPQKFGIKTVTHALTQRSLNNAPGTGFVSIGVAVKKQCQHLVQEARFSTHRKKNKGAVIMRAKVGPAELCVAGAHLDAGNPTQSVDLVMRGLVSSTQPTNPLATCHAVVVLGDLNYRSRAKDNENCHSFSFRLANWKTQPALQQEMIQLDTLQYSPLIGKYKLQALPFGKEQPTYKRNYKRPQYCREFDEGKDLWHNAKMCYNSQCSGHVAAGRRVPIYQGDDWTTVHEYVPVINFGWLDRILYKAHPELHVQVVGEYKSSRVTVSDHLPISATFALTTAEGGALPPVGARPLSESEGEAQASMSASGSEDSDSEDDEVDENGYQSDPGVRQRIVHEPEDEAASEGESVGEQSRRRRRFLRVPRAPSSSTRNK